MAPSRLLDQRIADEQIGMTRVVADGGAIRSDEGEFREKLPNACDNRRRTCNDDYCRICADSDARLL
jgi:hypothetical protein